MVEQAIDGGSVSDVVRRIQKECFETAKNSGFHDGDVDDNRRHGDPARQDEITRRLMLIMSEVTEAFEHHRNGEAVDALWIENQGLANKPDGVPIEMADIVIRVFDFCETYGIDLADALRIKMAFNKTREKRHGKEF